MSRWSVVPGLRAQGYERHTLHADGRIWVEKNCYVDVFIELLHALKLEPLAAMGFCAAVDFEGDSFTFFKPPHEDLRDLFGVDVQELNVWRTLLEHGKEHLKAGKLISTEADSFWLPDTAGTDYRRNHIKTTIIMADLDPDQRTLGYFHNAAYFELQGEDFERLFRIDAAPDATFLPLFAELVRIDRIVRRPPPELAMHADLLLDRHVARRPTDNPIQRFATRFNLDLPFIQEGGLSRYHTWAFATTRQLGSSMELLSAHLNWLGGFGTSSHLDAAATELARLSESAKAFILKAARAVNKRQTLEADEIFENMAHAWERGMSALAEHVSTRRAHA
jgi:hypothetical protein